jgi:hypothetical protein
MTKVCTACGEDRELGEYYISPNTKDGRNNKCKICILRKVQASQKSYTRICKWDECDVEFTTAHVVQKYCCHEHKIKQSNKVTAERKKSGDYEPKTRGTYAKTDMVIPKEFLSRGLDINIRTGASCMDGGA